MGAVTAGATWIAGSPALLVVAVGLVLTVLDDHDDEVREGVGEPGELQERDQRHETG